ncbi:hypothetical protein PtA15_14A344 [Puccinia triticina]|uniref:Uncharacterized protein n=1 Tax=Puccinia triticina TaxID=208348 RepID=A0ABY7D648_9BASI|nr:uncharacterized protein PtA15_14A344 [Puccinia triticina]WAQ91460.1 hypothetical protein PtA15_14A344 [Puccinia triticina]
MPIPYHVAPWPARGRNPTSTPASHHLEAPKRRTSRAGNMRTPAGFAARRRNPNQAPRSVVKLANRSQLSSNMPPLLR